jgi:hypothetical protein
VTTYNYNTQDPTFIEDLRKSRASVETVARWLSSKGVPVIVRPTFERPDASRMSEFSDDGDLEIIQRVEVKQRPNLDFTSKDDFPYPTLIVDACHCYDNAKQKPYAYVIVNRAGDVAFVVYVRDTRAKWLRVKKHDKAKQRDREFYECPMELVEVARLN